MSKNSDSMETMQGLAQSYTQDSQTKSDERPIMQVRNNQWLVIDRNVRIIVVSFHTTARILLSLVVMIVTKINKKASVDSQEYMWVRPW